MKGYKEILFSLLVCFLFNIGINAQSSKWKSYLAYQDATQVEVSSNYVFGIYDEALLLYSIDDEEVRTLSTENGLSDITIEYIRYHSGLKCLVIVYQNGNIDLFFGLNDITNIASLKDKESITNKEINNIDLIGNNAYISGAFGVMVLDLQRREVKYDFKWELDTRSIASWNGYLFASTEEGLWRADPSTNLQDRQNWENQQLNFPTSATNRQIEKLLVFKDKLVLNTEDGAVWVVDADYSVQRIYNSSFKQMSILNDQLVILRNNEINFHTDFSQKTTLPISTKDISSGKDGIYWLANGSEGLVCIEKSVNSNESQVKTSGIKVNSPIRNLVFNLKFSQDQLLVTGGARDADRSRNKGTFMVYENNKWYNLDDVAMTAAIRVQTGDNTLVCQDLISSIVDPSDSDHYYVSSWGEGVYELHRNNSEFELIKLHTYTNTNGALQTTLPTSSDALKFVRVDGLVYDNNNNLFMINGGVSNLLVTLKSDKTWKSFYDSELTLVYPNQLVVARNNLKWGNVFRPSGRAGVFVFNDNNTIDNTNDDVVYYSTSFWDQTGRSLSASNYSCVVEDQNGLIWVGTDNGPIYFSSAADVYNQVCNRLIGTDEYNQGYYVLDGINITAIAIDGGNRKWLGTKSNGVFMIDQSGGNLVVENYNTTNSLILSDEITALAINQKSGEIFIGTEKGLCSYQGEAIEGKSDYSNVYAYPNPVYPLSKNEVVITGLMENSTVKITDLAGNLIKEANSIGGQYTWDCTNVNREIVKAGIYLVFATSSDGSQGVVTKIMVIQ